MVRSLRFWVETHAHVPLAHPDLSAEAADHPSFGYGIRGAAAVNIQQADKYQLLPPMAPETYEVLKADIAVRGVVVPIDVDEDGNILDGHHRPRAWCELKKNEPLDGLSAGQIGAWQRYHTFLVSLSNPADERSPEICGSDIDWFLRHDFKTPEEWLGEEGDEYRNLCHMRALPNGHKEAWQRIGAGEANAER